MSRHFQLAVMTLAASLLAGCAAAPQVGNVPAGFREVPKARADIVFDDPSFVAVDPVRVAYRDPWERDEYALFRGESGEQAEVVYLAALPGAGGDTSLHMELVVSEGVRAFNHNAGTPITWGESRFVKSPFGGTWVQPFTMPKRDLACTGFGATWDVATSDPKLRPTRAMFGYYCAAKGAGLSPEQAAEVATKVGIVGVTQSRKVANAYELDTSPAAPLPSLQRQQELAVIAQDGAPGSVAGLPAFPLRRAQPFHPGAGGAKSRE